MLHISELTKGVRERVLTIKGSVEQVASAFALVCPKLVETEPESGGDVSQDITIALLVPNIMAGRIIGKGGEKIKTIKQNTNCSINVANDPIVRARVFVVLCVCVLVVVDVCFNMLIAAF